MMVSHLPGEGQRTSEPEGQRIGFDESVVRAHDRSLTGVVAPVADVGALVGELAARVSGFGPLQPFLDDPAVEEIWINDPSLVHERLPMIELLLGNSGVT